LFFEGFFLWNFKKKKKLFFFEGEKKNYLN